MPLPPPSLLVRCIIANSIVFQHVRVGGASSHNTLVPANKHDYCCVVRFCSLLCHYSLFQRHSGLGQQALKVGLELERHPEAVGRPLRAYHPQALGHLEKVQTRREGSNGSKPRWSNEIRGSLYEETRTHNKPTKKQDCCSTNLNLGWFFSPHVLYGLRWPLPLPKHGTCESQSSQMLRIYFEVIGLTLRLG